MPKTYRSKIEQKTFTRSNVDIIVPFHGQCEKVARLVQSILFSCRSNPYLITLVDDASPNKTFITDMKDVPQVNAIRSDSHDGFAASLLKGFTATKQPWVLFMHSDCVVEDGNWMLRLGETLQRLKSKGVKLVSSRTNNPISGDERLKADKSEHAQDIILGNDTFLPLYSAMCHRELFTYIGGFLKTYPYAFYEDEELAYRMRSFGYKQAISGTSWVYHEGECTIKEVSKRPEILMAMQANREKCIRDIKILKPLHK